jgi:opacity protein-like surface antigen
MQLPVASRLRPARSMHARLLLFIAASSAIVVQAHAQPAAPAVTAAQAPAFAHSNRFSVLGGLSQIAAGGGNVELNWHSSRFAFDYSHGFGLKFGGSLIGKAELDQKVELSMPWTTGFGIGYRLTSALEVRLEPKWHRYKVLYAGQDFSGTAIRSYTTTTLGVGAYYRVYPFARSTGWAKGVVMAPSVRYWPNVSSSLPGGKFTYANTATGRQETLRAATQGFPGTGGLLANVSLGYTF